MPRTIDVNNELTLPVTFVIAQWRLLQFQHAALCGYLKKLITNLQTNECGVVNPSGIFLTMVDALRGLSRGEENIVLQLRHMILVALTETLDVEMRIKASAFIVEVAKFTGQIDEEILAKGFPTNRTLH